MPDIKDIDKAEQFKEDIRNVIRKYFEADPWSGEANAAFDPDFTAQEAIDEIVSLIH